MLMGNRLFKTALLSLSTATLLTSSAFAANISAVVDSYDGGYLTKSDAVERIKLFEITTDLNADSALSELDELNITFAVESEDNVTISFLEDVVIYHNSIDAGDRVTSVTIPDFSTETSKNVIVDLSQFSSDAEEKVQFKSDYKNLFYVFATYNQLTDGIELDNANNYLSATLNSMKGTYQIGEAGSESEDIDANVAETTFNVDTIAPILDDVSELNNTDSDRPLDNEIVLTFTEGQIERLDVSNATFNSAFEIRDVRDDFNITEWTFNDANTIVTLTLDADVKNSSVGDISFEYKGGLFQDKFANFVGGNVSIIFTDEKRPTMEKIELSFEDENQGRILFSELLQDTSWNDVNLTLSDNFTFVSTPEQAEINTNGYPQTVLNFEVENEDNDVAGADFTITYYQKFDDGIAGIYDFGDNNITNDTDASPAIGTLGLDIEADSWNLISISSGSLTTSRKMFESGAVQIIWGYEDNEWTRSPKLIEAGKGYWVKGLNANVVGGFSDTETTGYGAVAQTGLEAIAGANTDDEWELLGTTDDIRWADAYKQVNENCHAVSVFAYNAQTGEWNGDDNISANSGFWVRQDNCE
jgi:hypothetical protein